MLTAISALSCEQPPAECAARWSPVAAEAQRRLQTSPYPSHRRLECASRAGVLIVQGRVSSFYMKQMAWALVADIDGLDQFIDRVEVAEPA